jgi:hypothetical protein
VNGRERKWKKKEGVRIWNSGGKNPLLLLLATSSHEEILYLAAGRAVCLCSMQAGREEWDEKSKPDSKSKSVRCSVHQVKREANRHCTVQGIL